MILPVEIVLNYFIKHGPETSTHEQSIMIMGMSVQKNKVCFGFFFNTVCSCSLFTRQQQKPAFFYYYYYYINTKECIFALQCNGILELHAQFQVLSGKTYAVNHLPSNTVTIFYSLCVIISFSGLNEVKNISMLYTY